MTLRTTWERAVGWAYPTLVGAIAIGAFGARVQNLDVAPYGDEAYYYFTSNSLSHFFDTTKYPVAGSAFPVMPLLYRPFSHTLASTRTMNALVGAIAVVLVVLILRELKVAWPLQLGAALLVALNPIQVQFSALVFEDMLGAVIALAAVLAYIKGRPGLAAALAAAAVLEKEYYAIFGFALFLDYAIAKRRVYWQMIVAGVVVIGWVVIRFGLLHAPIGYLLSVHASVNMTLGAIGVALGTWYLAPLVVAGAVLSDRLRAAAYFLVTFLGFLTLWKNVQEWYFCLTIPLAVILAAYGADLLWRRLQPRLAPAAAIALALSAVLMGVSLFFFQQDTRNFIRVWHNHDLNLAADYIHETAPGPRPAVALVGCFWAYQYHPFEDSGLAASSVQEWGAASGSTALRCPESPAPPPGWTVAYRAGDYAVLTR